MTACSRDAIHPFCQQRMLVQSTCNTTEQPKVSGSTKTNRLDCPYRRCQREIQGAMSQERYEDLNLIPPEEGFELYRYKNAEKVRTSGWAGL